LKDLFPQDPFEKVFPTANPYDTLKTYLLISSEITIWMGDLHHLLDANSWDSGEYQDPFFENVAHPMLKAYRTYKELDAKIVGINKFELPLDYIDDIEAEDWSKACIEWIIRRRNNWVDKYVVRKSNG
jgi:hypothetical protein